MRLYDPSKPNPKGMPRPVAKAPSRGPDGRFQSKLLPVPWTQNSDSRRTNWGKLHYENASEACKKSRCLLCGGPVEKGMVFISRKRSTKHFDPWPPVIPVTLDDAAYFTDNAPLHERCAKLTAAHCPRLKRDLASGEQVICSYEQELDI